MTDFFAKFLDDYFVEADEHLAILLRNLLLLEQFVLKTSIDRSLLDELFRSFHSLKGLSGMVGVKEAEELSHEMESYLRALREQQVRLTSEGLEALWQCTKLLETVIANYRNQTAAPDIAAAIASLKSILPNSGNQTPKVKTPEKTNNAEQIKLKPEESDRMAAAVAKGANIWSFEFASAPELAQRGINVNSIRDRLQAIGELIHTEPRVTKQGQIVFNFLVATKANQTTFIDWENDGLIYTPYLITSESKKEEEIIVEAQDPEPAAEEEKIHPQPTSIATIAQSNLVHLEEITVEAQDQETAAEEEKILQLMPIATTAQSNLVRVDMTRLDELMRMVGELVISRARLEDNIIRLTPSVPASQLRALRETNLTLERQLRSLREGVMQVRMVPIGEIFARMQFVVRDLAKESQKQVLLELKGQETEIDKFVVDRMIDPMLHLVRNAVSHGLESETERVKLGKSPQGKLALRATCVGETVAIEIEDDGRGVDAQKVIARAKKIGVIEEGKHDDANTILDILCASGFSTREQADLTSGRGMGMAVVKNTILELGGLLSLDTQIGKGTRFTIQLPLTLAIADALIVLVGGQTFAIPQLSVLEVMEVQPSAVTVLENNEIVSYRGGVLPLVRLARLFGLADEQSALLYVLVVGNTTDVKERSPNSVAIAVDRIVGMQEIVIRPLTDPLVRVTGIAGATELGNGRVVLILDPNALRGRGIEGGGRREERGGRRQEGNL